MSTHTFSPERAERLMHGYGEWAAKQRPSADDTNTFAEMRAQLQKAFETLPERVELPYHLTPEGERLAQFKRTCDAEFSGRIDRTLLKNPQAFDRVAGWDGAFPGPLAVGPTGTAKTRAAWSALGRLWVRGGRSFKWWPVRLLVTELEKYESNNAADEFFRMADFHTHWFVDDADKVNWDFESSKTLLFSFYDWVYRHRKPCVTTTNKPRKWWTDKMGDAFARRLFDEAQTTVVF